MYICIIIYHLISIHLPIYLYLFIYLFGLGSNLQVILVLESIANTLQTPIYTPRIKLKDIELTTTTTYICIYLYIHLSIHLYIYIYIYIFFYLSFLSIYLYLSIYLSIYLFIQIEEASPAPMSLEKMRTLVALLLKKISTPSRLKKLGFGSRLIGEDNTAFTSKFQFQNVVFSTQIH